nr:cystathionine gamma-lyase-like [Leptinotarsa decemlineata]
METPSDPTLNIYDIRLAAQIAKESQILLGVDNTYATPFMQRPLELGADMVLDSGTRYINGHSDSLLGCLTVNSETLMKKMFTVLTVLGPVPSPFDCYQVLRGMKTLGLRMMAHHEHSLTIANYLEKHPAVEKVIHPDYYINSTCEVTIIITEVAGGIESTIEIPYIMSNKTMPKNRKTELNITENLIKLSVGLESICDLIVDLEQALDFLKSSNESSCK